MAVTGKTIAPQTLGDVLGLLGEQLRESSERPNIYHYEPHAKQQLFHRSPARIRLYIGGNRSGKTVGGVVEDCYWLRRDHPYRRIPDRKISGRVVTVDITEGLNQIILPQFAQWLPPSALKNGSWEDSYSKQDRQLTLDNGSTCEFLTYEMEVEKFAGTSRDFVHYDEEPPKEIYTECQARLIDKAGSSWITMTPLLGMTWVFDLIYEPGIEHTNPLIEVIEVSMYENPYLPVGEADIFLSGLDEGEREAREKGHFIQLGGLIYPKFDTNIHVLESKTIPKDWFWARSLDHGFRAPTAWLWHAVAPEGTIITFREHYEAGLTVEEHAERVHAIDSELGREPDIAIGDPAIAQHQGVTGTSILEEYARFGIPIVPANNDVQSGIIRVARYIEPRPVPKDPNASLRPKWFTYPECANLIKELRKYRWKVFSSKKVAARSNEPEVPQKKNDHACDSLRYFIMSRPDLSNGHFDPSQFDPNRFNPLGLFDKSWGQYKVGDELQDSVWRENSQTVWNDDVMGGDW